jgi:cation transport regulator ChaC
VCGVPTCSEEWRRAVCLRVALWRGTAAYGGSCIGRGKGKDRDCESVTAVETKSSRLPGGDVEW